MKIRIVFTSLGIGLLLSLTSCNKLKTEELVYQQLEIPLGFPTVEYPFDNEYSISRWELGKKLFFDPVMSRDSSVSCASCHNPQLAFATNEPTNSGISNRPGIRNSPSLANVAYFPYFIREGSVPTLEMQVLIPIQEHNEFDYNIVDLSEKLKSIPEYVELAQIAYNRIPDPFAITRALANFERSLISGNSQYDKYRNGSRNALTKDEINGKELFFSERTNCVSCHSGFLFTDHSFQNNGLYVNYPDSGRMRFTLEEDDRALFKVPSLRNVGLTFPYMHDGNLSTLEDVVDHYNSGGAGHVNQSDLIRPLNLSEKEKMELVKFLHSLTDYQFVNNQKWR